MSFDHYSQYHDPTEYQEPPPPPTEKKTVKKQKKRNCYQLNTKVPEPPVIGWGVERGLKLRLREMYDYIIWGANEVYYRQYILTLDDSGRKAEGVTETDAQINGEINELIHSLSLQRDGDGGYRVCCDQIVRAGGNPWLLPTDIENALIAMLGQPPPLPDNPMPISVWRFTRTPNDDSIKHQHLRYPAQYFEGNHLNQTLRKVYKCMSIIVNEIWDREDREDHGPPTVVVETNVLRSKLRKMKVVADKIVLRISQRNQEHLPMPRKLSDAVSRITEKILE